MSGSRFDIVVYWKKIRHTVVLRRKRITQSKVAAELNITYQQLQKYEQGQNKIPASRIHKIAKILGVSLHDIMVGPSKNFEQIRKLQNERAALLWQKLDNDEKRHVVLMLLEQLTVVSA